MPPLLLSIALAASLQGAEPRVPVFERDIFPIFNRRCAECHGISKQSGGLRLDSFDGLRKGSKKGQVVVPGKSAQSRLVELIQEEGKKRMPPKGDRVPQSEVELIRRWIDEGARSGPSSGAEEEVKLGKLPAGFSPVLAVAGDPKGARVTCGRGPSIVVTRFVDADPKSDRPEAVLDAGPDLVDCLAWSPDGKLLASGGFREALLWDTATWTLRRRLGPHADRVLALRFNRDGLLATGGGLPSQSGEVKVWEAATGKLFRSLPDAHSDTVFSVDWSPDGLTLASGGADRMVHLLDVFSGKRIARLEGHTHHVLAVAFSADGKKLLSGGADSKIKTWNVEKAESIRDWGGHGKAVTALAVSPDGKQAFSASGDRSLRVWNPDNGSQVRAWNEAKDYLYAVCVFADGKYVAAAGRDQVVRVYETKDQKLFRAVDPPALP